MNKNKTIKANQQKRLCAGAKTPKTNTRRTPLGNPTKQKHNNTAKGEYLGEGMCPELQKNKKSQSRGILEDPIGAAARNQCVVTHWIDKSPNGQHRNHKQLSLLREERVKNFASFCYLRRLYENDTFEQPKNNKAGVRARK